MAVTTKEKLFGAIKNIPSVSASEGWVFTRDADEGTVFYSPNHISDGAELHQISSECALYVDKKSFAPRGIVIEYYDNNFIEHHPELKEISGDVFGKQKQKDKVVVDPSKKGNKQAKYFKAIFESIIITEALTKPV